ncbi:MAG TPA: hypothetical protein VKU84_14770 [Stellaceae bacterium]|nr:hypothetical protein [Stellaceae bacterium]
MSFIAGHTNGVKGSMGPTAQTTMLGSDGSLRSIAHTLSASLTPTDIVKHGSSPMAANNAHDGSKAAGVVTHATGNAGATVPLNLENHAHNPMMPKH